MPADAITGQAFAWRELLARWGHAGEIIAEHVHRDLADEVQPLDRPGRRLLDSGNVVLHYAIWSKTAQVALRRPERVALCYHNITPGSFLRAFNPDVADLCDRGRRALTEFPEPAVLIADSHFNAVDLREAGLGEATVVPLLLDFSGQPPVRAGAGPDPVVLSVGRMVPNKRFEDVIKAFALFQRRHAPTARLVLISAVGFDNYRAALDRLIRQIDVKNVIFTGPISNEARDAWYSLADAYLSMSMHEGFGAPLIEALAHGVPVVARAAGAVPETIGGAGLVLDSDDLAVYAEALNEVVNSPHTRVSLARLAEARLEQLRPEAVAEQIRGALRPLLDGS
jgi:glycosyltransferase involved in cell wall biosynthesis